MIVALVHVATHDGVGLDGTWRKPHEVFLQKYGPEEKYDILQHIPRVQCPLLIMVGTAEAQTMVAFHGLPPMLERIAATMDDVTFASIPGADHTYTHQRDYVWSVW